MTAGPTPNKFVIAVAVTIWLLHGLATGAASVLDVSLAIAIVAALLWPEPVIGRDTLDPLPRVLSPPGAGDGWPPGYKHVVEESGSWVGHGWISDERDRCARGFASEEAARIGAWRDARSR